MLDWNFILATSLIHFHTYKQLRLHHRKSHRLLVVQTFPIIAANHKTLDR